MKNDRPKENEKGKYKRFSQFPSRNYTLEKAIWCSLGYNMYWPI